MVSESVLCVKAAEVTPLGMVAACSAVTLGELHGLMVPFGMRNIQDVLRILRAPLNIDNSPVQFLPRENVETDETWLQLIPYVTLWRQSADGPEIFAYQRSPKSGEHRLHAKWSCGLGGHVSQEDLIADNATGLDCLLRAGRREVEEEVGLVIKDIDYAKSIRRLILRNDTPVDRVHLGFWILQEVGAVERLQFGPEIADWRWVKYGDKSLAWETWSQVVQQSSSFTVGSAVPEFVPSAELPLYLASLHEGQEVLQRALHDIENLRDGLQKQVARSLFDNKPGTYTLDFSESSPGAQGLPKLQLSIFAGNQVCSKLLR